MAPKPLPESPNLEQLKKQAKSLLKDAHDQRRDALARFIVLPAWANVSIEQIDVRELALHDAQSVIAREHGFVSWNALREEVEARTLTFPAAVDAFIRAASDGASDRAKRLLALHPAIANATLHTELLLGDAEHVAARLRDHPELATVKGGPQDWEPLLYVCHSCLHRDDPARLNGLVTIAKQLLGLGADPNGEYHWNWHPELPRTVLWGALVTMGHVPLAELLLDSGARPTDGVTAHIAGGGGNLKALELLHRHGMDPNGLAGGVPPLVYIMQYATDSSGPLWLLDHGADANLSWGTENEAPLHVAARRWNVAMVDALLAHGADPSRRRADGYTPHTLAELHGNRDIARTLLAHGATSELRPLEQFIAAAARADAGAADTILAAHPGLEKSLTAAQHLMLHRPAESGNAAALETMLARGFDPAVPDKDGVTALHRAAMAGHPAAVKVLLTFGAPVNAHDGMFSAPPIVWAVEGRGHAQPGSDHVAVARLLIDAGSAVEWTPPPAAPGPERTLDGLRQLRREAGAPA